MKTNSFRINWNWDNDILAVTKSMSHLKGLTGLDTSAFTHTGSYFKPMITYPPKSDMMMYGARNTLHPIKQQVGRPK